jgi:phospholipase/lecithinase/hemolysin
MRHRLRLILVSVALAASAARGQVSFEATVTFGDSLTAQGVEDGLPEAAAALYGRDPIEALFAKASKKGDSLKNYARSGARACDVNGQIAAYAQAVAEGKQKLATVASFGVGGNDILVSMARLALAGPGRFDFVDSPIDELIETIKSQIATARSTHPQTHLIVWTVPDVTLVPGLASRVPAGAARHVRAHIKRVNDVIRGLESDSRISIADLDAMWELWGRQPPVLLGRALKPPPANGTRDSLFADPLHPSGVCNALIANGIIARINKRWSLRVPPWAESELAQLAGFVRAAPGPVVGH